MAAEIHCSKHPQLQAGWICQVCSQALCQHCAYRRRAGHGEIVVCAHDGGFAQPVLVPRIRGTFPELFQASFVYPFSPRGLVTMVVGGVVLSSLAYVGIGASLLGALVLITYLYFLVRATSLGEEDLPRWKDLLNLGQVFLGVVRFGPALFTTLLPFVLYVVYFKHWAGLASYATDPIAYATLLIGVLWAPMSFMLAAAASPLTTILNPLVAARYIWRTAGPYFATTGMLVALSVGTVIIYVLGRFFAATLDVPAVPVVYAAAVTMYLPLVGARIVGVLLLKRGTDIGIAELPQYLIPALEESELRPEPLRERVDDSDLDIDFSNAPNAIELPEAPAEGTIDALVPIASAMRAGDLTTNAEDLAPISLSPGVIEVPESSEDLVVQHQLSLEVEALPRASTGSIDLGAALNGNPADLTMTEATFDTGGADPNGVLLTKPDTSEGIDLSDSPDAAPPLPRADAAPIPKTEVARIELKKTEARRTEVKRPDTGRTGFSRMDPGKLGSGKAPAPSLPPAPSPSTPPPLAARASTPSPVPARASTPSRAPKPESLGVTAQSDAMELETSTTPAPFAAAQDEPTDEDVRFMAEAEDYDSIVDAYRARKGTITNLNDEELFRTAEAAQNMSDMATAAHVLRRLAHDHPKSTLAPDAMLNAGILLMRELDNPSDGKRLLNRLIRTYPESTAANSARRMVESPK